MGALVASRFTYRRLFRRAAWLTLPVLALLALFFPVVVFSTRQRHALVHIFRLLAAGFAIELILVAVALAFVVAQLHDSLGSISWLSRALRDNDAARGAAVGLAAGGGAGLVTGHSGRAELTDLGGGAFYANCGTAGRTVDRVETRGGLPAVYAARLRCSWVELEAGSELRARLWHGARDLPERTLLERISSRERMRACWPPAEVAEHPGTVTWPSAGDATASRRRTRRIAAAAIAFAGVLNLVSAVTLPIASRLDALDRFTPIDVPELAAALVAICAIGLILLARGVRRGQRHAWLFANALLLVAVVGNVTKGLDIEEAIIALLVVVFLVVHRDDFAAPANPSSWRRGLGAALLAIAVAIIGGTIGVAFRHPNLSIPKIAEAVTGRLVGMKPVALPHDIDRLVSPALLAVGVGVGVSFCWLLFRPAVSPRLSSYRPNERGSSSSGTAPTRCRTSRCETTKSGSASGTRSSPTACITGSRSCRRIRSARSASEPRRGERSGSSPTSTAGRSRSWERVLIGFRPTGRAECTTCTSATKRWATCGASVSTASRTRACASR